MEPRFSIHSIINKHKKKPKKNTSQRLLQERSHFDQMVEGRGSEVIFYDTPYLQSLLKDIEGFVFRSLGNLEGKKVLLYGCGVNLKPVETFLDCGAACIYMIDISPKSIEAVSARIKKAGMDSRVSPAVMDCENLSYNNKLFDVIYGRAILHHLDMARSLDEIKRVLKDGGRAVFLEPLGMNPFINFYRKLTPDRRTPDEKPLNNQDFKIVCKAGFSNVEHHEFTLFANLGILLNTILKVTKQVRISYKTFKRIDDFVLKKFSFLKKFCWNTVLILTK